MWPFRHKHPKDNLSIIRLLPQKIHRSVKLAFGIGEAIVAAIWGTFVAQTYMWAAVVAYGINLALTMAVSFALSYASSFLAKKNTGGSITNNGRQFNTKSVSEPVRIIYGECKVGGNLLFIDPSAKANRDLNIIVGWGEGEVEGIAKEIDTTADYYSGKILGEDEGLNDLSIKGTYTGTENRYQVVIDAIGTPDEYTWSDDAGATWEATGVEISGLWQLLNNGVYVKFANTTGHILGGEWSFAAGDGIWLGDKLMIYYEHYKASHLNIAERCLAYHTLHTGTDDQIVDADLTSREPLWNDPLHNESYSYFRLIWNDSAWPGIPELKITLKGLKVYNPWDDVTEYTRNPALVWYDMMTNKRYGFGMDPARIDTDSVEDAAIWCDANGYYFDGVFIDRTAFADHVEDMLKNFRAFVIRSNGIYKLKIFTDDAACMTLTEDEDIEIEKGIVIDQPGIIETPNRVKTIFINREKGNTTDFAVYPDSDVVISDERIFEIPLTGISTFEQAKKLAKYHYLRSQFNKTFTMLCHPRVGALEPGDMVQIESDYLGWVESEFGLGEGDLGEGPLGGGGFRKVRVLNSSLPQDGLIPITFQEEDPSIYDQTINIEDEPIWISSTTDKTADKPSGLEVLETASDESTRNKTDTYVDLAWDNNLTGDFVLNYRKEEAAKWSVKNVPNIQDDDEDQIVVRLGGLPADTNYEWRVRNKIENSLSEWVDGTPFTTWSPDGPDMADVVLELSNEEDAVLVKWEMIPEDYNIYEWYVYRNSVDNSATAILLDNKSRQTRSYRDLQVVANQTYYYWLKAIDRFGVLSTDFSAGGSINHIHVVLNPVFQPTEEGDVSEEEGSQAYIADIIALQDCDDYSQWVTDSVIANSIIVSQEVENFKQGTGCLKIEIFKYAKQRYYEAGISTIALGRVNAYRYICQAVKPDAGFDMNAIGLKIIKVRNPSDLLVKFYDDDSGKPGNLLGSATLLAANVPTSLQSAPNDYLYPIYDPVEPVLPDTLYWIALDPQGTSLLNYYKLFWNDASVNQFGDADEIMLAGNVWGSLTEYPTKDINFRLCAAGDALNKLIYSTIASKNISTKEFFKGWARAYRTGINLQLGFGESGMDENLFDVNIAGSNVWQHEENDITGIGTGDRDAVTKVGIKITNMDSDNLVYLDDLVTNVGGPVMKLYHEGEWKKFILEGDSELSLMNVDDWIEYYEDFIDCPTDLTTGAYVLMAGAGYFVKIAGIGGLAKLVNAADMSLGDATFKPFSAAKYIDFKCSVSRFDADNFVTRWGFSDASLSSAPSNGIYISQTNDGGNFIIYCRDGGSESTLDTTVASSDGVWHKIRLAIFTTSVDCYVDDVLVGSIVTNIPSADLGFFLYTGGNTVNKGFKYDVLWISQGR